MASAVVSAVVNQAAAMVSVAVGPRWLAGPGGSGVHAHGHLLAGAFDRVDDDVRGIGVDPGDAGERDRDPGLLEDLPPDRRGDRLAHLDAPAGQLPVAVIGAPDEENPAARSRTIA